MTHALRSRAKWSTFDMIVKNTDPYKLKKCVKCKKDIALNELYFAYPLSLQQMCLACAEAEIPKTIESLEKDLNKIRQSKA